MSEKIIIAGVAHGKGIIGRSSGWFARRRITHGNALLEQIARKTPGASIGLETTSSKSLFQVLTESISGEYRHDLPLGQTRAKIVASELIKRVIILPEDRQRAVEKLSRFKTVGELRQAIEQGAFGFFEAIHLKAEELDLKVEPIDNPKLRSEAAEAVKKLRKFRFNPGRSWQDAMNEIKNLRNAHRNLMESTFHARDHYMTQHVEQNKLPLYLVGIGHAVAMNRALRKKLPVKLVKVRFAWKPKI